MSSYVSRNNHAFAAKARPQARSSAPTLDAVADPATLREAWSRTLAGTRYPGGDGVWLSEFAADLPRRLGDLSAHLRDGTYRPGDPFVFEVPKPDGTVRLVQIPDVADRVVLQATKLVLMPAVERILPPCSFAYRPGRDRCGAAQRVEAILSRSSWLVRIDVATFFPSVRHEYLMAALARLTGDRGLLALLRRLVLQGAAGPGVGICTGTALSPMLSNVYLCEFDALNLAAGRQITRFGDDMVFGCGSQADAHRTLSAVRQELAKLGLRLNEPKCAISPVTQGLRFLGFQFGPDGRVMSQMEPAGARPDALKPVAAGDRIERERRSQGPVQAGMRSGGAVRTGSTRRSVRGGNWLAGGERAPLVPVRRAADRRTVAPGPATAAGPDEDWGDDDAPAPAGSWGGGGYRGPRGTAAATAGPGPAGRGPASRWSGDAGRLVSHCTVLQSIEATAARSGHLRHEHRLIVLYSAGRLGDEGARYLHRVMSHCSDYDAGVCNRYLDRLDPDRSPITCRKIREWLAVGGEEWACACGRDCHSPLDGLREPSAGASAPGPRGGDASFRRVAQDVFDGEDQD